MTRRGGYPRRRSPVAQAVREAAVRVVAGDLAPFPTVPREGGPEGHVTVVWTPNAPVVSVNRFDTLSWPEQAAIRKAWQGEAADTFTRNAALLTPYRGCRVEITVALPVPDRRRRDPHNYVCVVKPLVDGVTRTGLLIPDDNAAWCTVPEPILYCGSEVRVRVRVAPPSEDPRLW